jgi:hypothetical protein
VWRCYLTEPRDNKSAIPALEYGPRQIGRFQHLYNSAFASSRRRGLKLWAVVTVGLYLPICTVVFVPIVASFYGKRHAPAFTDLLCACEFWVMAAFLVIAQILMLVVPLRASWEYKIKPRRLMIPLVTASVLMGILTVGVALSLLTIPFGESPPTLAIMVGGATVLASWVF